LLCLQTHACFHNSIFSLLLPPPTPPLFPYTTLFRSPAPLEPGPHRRHRTEKRGGARPQSDRHPRAERLVGEGADGAERTGRSARDRKSTRLNSSHVEISYAVFCLKKKNDQNRADGAQ